MLKAPKTKKQLEELIQAEAARIGPWPRNMRVLVYPLDGSWRAMFGYSEIADTPYRDKVAAVCIELRDRYDLID